MPPDQGEGDRDIPPEVMEVNCMGEQPVQAYT
ncbi:hypothetical protein KIPB_009185, partial [Kipferlia bialata]|eukprot:g9185.t1